MKTGNDEEEEEEIEAKTGQQQNEAPRARSKNVKKAMSTCKGMRRRKGRVETKSEER